MNNLFINPDNTNWQAQGVLAALRRFDGVEHSWDDGQKRYIAEPEVNPWFNGRERGYVISMHSFAYDNRFHIAFFEHRNSDDICAVKFELKGLNPPTINEFPSSHPYYHSKYDYDFSVPCGHFIEMSDWIIKELNTWWVSTTQR